VRLGEDHNWWVAETSDPVRWDVDGLSIVDPRQMSHLIELVEALRDYGFNQDNFESAFILFRIDKDLGSGKVRLKRVKESVFDSEEKLFALPDILDEENGPYADLLDHLTRCRVKLLNDLFNFEAKLSVDEVEDEIREDQNFEELTAILDYMPAGYDGDEEAPAKGIEDEEDDDLPELDAAEEEKLKNDDSLKWDEDDDKGEDDEDGEKKKSDDDDDEDSDDDEPKAKSDDEDEKPKRKAKGKR
jgi:hypothetical protein